MSSILLSSSDSDLFICYSVLPGNAQDALLPSVVSSVFHCSSFIDLYISAVCSRFLSILVYQLLATHRVIYRKSVFFFWKFGIALLWRDPVSLAAMYNAEEFH